MSRTRPTLVVMIMALAMLASTPGTLFAEAGKAGSEEQPNILSPRFDLTIWTIVVFALLYLVLRYVKLPGASAPAFVMMLEGLRNRERSIQNDLAEAERARQEAHKLRAEFQAEIDRAHEKVRDIMDQARRDAQKTADDMVAKARVDIQAERERLHRDINTARDQALKQLWEQSAQLATLISAKAIRRQLSPEDHRRLVDEALADLQGARRDRIA